MFENYKYENIRDEIKHRLESELKMCVPYHRRIEIESALYYISVFENEEKRKKGK